MKIIKILKENILGIIINLIIYFSIYNILFLGETNNKTGIGKHTFDSYEKLITIPLLLFALFITYGIYLEIRKNLTNKK